MPQTRFVFRKGLLILTALILSFIPASISIHAQQTAQQSNNTDYLHSLWVAGSDGITKISVTDNTILLKITDIEDVSHVAVDEVKNILWAYTKDGFLKSYNINGASILSVAVPQSYEADNDDDDDTGHTALVVNPQDGAVYLGVGKSLFKYDSNGVLRLTLNLSRNIKALSLDKINNRIWAATKKTISAYDSTGAVILNLDLGKDPHVEDIDADTDSGDLWAAVQKGVRRYAANGSLLFETLFEIKTDKPQYIANNIDGVWVAAKKELLKLDKSGSILLQTNPPESPFGKGGQKGDSNKKITVLIADHSDQTIWTANKGKKLSHINTDGQTLSTQELDEDINDLAVYRDTNPPIITITSPENSAYINSRQPAITITYSDIGSGVDPAALTILANGSALQATCVTTDTDAVCTPGTALNQGSITLKATVKDYAGNTSEPSEITFTIDTTPPQINITSPVTGSFLNINNPAIDLSYSDTGSGINTVTLSITGNNYANVISVPLGATHVSFTSLPEGLITATASAADLAGNTATSAAIGFTIDTIPPSITITSPADGSTIEQAEQVITGQVSESATLTINGQTITTNSNNEFSYSVTLIQGINTFNLYAKDPAGNISQKSITITLAIPQDPLPPDPAIVATPIDTTVATTAYSATAFLYTGENPIQTGVAAGTIAPTRIAVLRGKVSDDSGSPISGVKITILNHTEFGSTLTRQDGMFDMAVNGGGWLTVNYQKDGYLPVQRQVNAPWQDYAWLSDVVMIPYDTKVTVVDLNSTEPIQVARGNPSTDADGTRTATLFFQQGSTATMTLANGTTQPLTNLNVRATEYTVGANGPKRMPAPLPPTSGYTYAVEFSADEAVAIGAKYITFNKPVISYTENFLNFPVGTAVPVGFYDKDKGIWTAGDDGRIIKIISITNGMADIDTTGANIPATAASLSSLGITDAERQQLATLYQPGQSLWRVQLYKLMDPDYNWSIGVATAQDAKNPSQPLAKTDAPPDKPTSQCGSIIGCETQTLGETLDITGTSFTLHYQSDRVPGRIASRTLEIPLIGSAVPSSLLRIELEIYVAGRKFIYSFGAAANQSYTWTWDSKDGYGRTLQGKQEVKIRIGYVYRATYFAPGAGCPKGFACSIVGGAIVAANNIVSFERSEYTMWQEQKTAISNFDASSLGLGAWTLNIQHVYDPTGQTLYLGNGEKRSAKDINSVITTFAGNGATGYSGDGGPATSARLFGPIDVTADNNGNLYIADSDNKTVRKVTPNGIISTVASIGNAAYSVTVDSQGNLFIAATGNHIIQKVSPEGIVTTVAGTGAAGYSGDGGPATSAYLRLPYGVAVDNQGNLFIADTFNHRIRKVSPDGIITTVAGNGICCFSGDGGPAANAKLYYPKGIAVDNHGNIIFSDSGNKRIRKITPDGIITTIAGGSSSYPADGNPATSAALLDPFDVTADKYGNIFISDSFVSSYNVTCLTRKVSPDGIITTAAGNGTSGFSGDGGPATRAQYDCGGYQGLAVDSQGNLFFADSYNNRIRKVAPPLPGFTDQNIAIPSEDGKELYGFDQYGKHLRTVDTITGITLYTFTYNSAGILTSITDKDNNITTIERDASSNATAIIAPGTQRTALTMDANGYLASITNPVAQSFSFAYTNDGLMTSFTNPRGSTSTFTYDSLGRLTKDTNAIGGYKALTRTDNSNSKYTVTLSTALGRTDAYSVETLSTGDTKRTNTDPSNLTTTTNIGTNGTTIITEPDGTITTRTEGPDPRFGMQSPVTTALTIKMPSNLTYTMSGTRTATLSDSTNLLSLTALTDTVTLNGKTYTNAYIASSKQYTLTTPVGRKSYTTLDSLGRVSQEQFDNLNAVSYTYDTRGRLTTVVSGQGSVDSRNYSIAYDPVGWALPTSITDPLGRSVNFVYDGAGRVTQKTLPDGRVIMFTYDANGNITSITPPSKPAHSFTYTGVDLEETYNPPLPQGEGQGEGGVWNTQYSYNLDKQLMLITRPDAQTISLNYDTGGRLNSIVTPPLAGGAGGGGTISYAYSGTTGNLTTITAPSETLSFTFDGSLLKNTSWTGVVSGSVGFNYNSDFRVSTETVNSANSISFTYDNDGLLTGAGALTLTRNTSNGLISGTTLGSTTTSQSYNGFGEMSQLTANYGASTLFNVQYTRDKLGRITQKVETAHGVTNTDAYSYDTAGRLTDVALNGSNVRHYVYDGNSNRISFTNANGTVTGTYDNQDRLQAYGNNTYTYTTNGELQSKTNGSGTTTYQYDVLGNLRSATLPNSTVIEYVIDGQNRRIGKKINGAFVQGFLYENQLRPVAELDGTGAIVSRFVYGTKINVPEYIVRGSTTYRIITDHLGSPRFVIDTITGIVAQEMDYDEFGNVIFDTNPAFQPFGFAGGIYDQHTKLTRFGARDYDAETGRWISKDPIRFNGGDTNLFGYLLSDPINGIDPFGLVNPISWLYWNLRGPTLVTDMSSGTTTFYPGLFNSGSTYSIETRNDVDSHSASGAQDPFTTPNVTPLSTINDPAYGPYGAYIDTGDPRGRDIHGGGSSLPNPYAPQQGWRPTFGCTRGQNEDVQELNRRIQEFITNHPGVPIPYVRQR